MCKVYAVDKVCVVGWAVGVVGSVGQVGALFNNTENFYH